MFKFRIEHLLEGLFAGSKEKIWYLRNNILLHCVSLVNEERRVGK